MRPATLALIVCVACKPRLILEDGCPNPAHPGVTYADCVTNLHICEYDEVYFELTAPECGCGCAPIEYAEKILLDDRDDSPWRDL